MVFEPVKNWTLALDYYNIERKDEIGTRTVGDVLKGEASLPAGQLVRTDNTAADNEFIALAKKYAPGTTVNFGGVGKLGLVYNPYVNSGKTRASGFDFDVAGRVKIQNVGDLRLKLEGTYALNYQVFEVADNAYGMNSAGNYDAGSRLRTKLRASLKVGAFDHGTTINYTGGYSLNSDDSLNYCVTSNVSAANMPACERVRSNTTLDYNLSYSGIKNVKLSVYINNLLNKDAQVNYRDVFTAPQFRTFAASATYTF